MSLVSLLAIPHVKKFLQDGDVYLELQELAEKHALPEGRVSELLDVTDAILDEQIQVSEMPALLQEAFGLSEENANEFAREIAEIRLLPLEEFLPGVSEQILAWGGKVQEQGRRVEKEKITGGDLARRIVNKLSLPFSDLLVKRLAFLIEQRANNQKTEESLRTFFGRPVTIGGLELQKEKIDVLMEEVRNRLKGSVIIQEEEKLQEEKGREGEKEETTSEEKNTWLEIAPSHEVASEVPVISSPEKAQEQLRQRTEEKRNITERALLEESPERIAMKKAEKARKMQEAIKVAFQEAIDSALEKTQALREKSTIPSAAFADIAGKMFRGIRDQYQTRDVLERDYKVRGDDLAQLMQHLLDAEGAYKIAGDALEKIEAGARKISDSDAESWEAEEAEKGEARFRELTGHAEKPAPATIELTVGSVPPVQGEGGSGAKKVTDIVAGNKLMGPIEQLGTITLADFRRLSTNPEEAVRKMEALLQALQKTSYEDRVQGVLAWRKSPLAMLYVALMTESLNTGVAVAEITARRRAQGQESLGPAEMHALAKWNEQTRF